MVDFIAIGDTHVDGMPSVLPAKVANSAVPLILEQAIAQAEFQNVENLMLLGDLFDGNLGSIEGHMQYLDFMVKCKKLGLRCWGIDGNHGYEHQDKSSIRLLKHIAEASFPNFKLVTGKPYVEKIEGQQCIFLPWPYTNAVELSRKPSLVFAHVPRPGVKMPSEYRLKDVKDFDLGRHFWVIGDIHEPQSGKGFVYPGCIVQQKFGDSRERSFVKVSFDNGKARWNRLPITSPFVLGEMVAQVWEDLKVLDERPLNEWTKVKVGRELLSKANKITQSYKRVKVEPLTNEFSAEKAEGETVVKRESFENSWDFRSKLLARRMKR